MKMKEVLDRIEKNFNEKLQEKTGWGKNEIALAYKSAVNDALIAIAEKVTDD